MASRASRSRLTSASSSHSRQVPSPRRSQPWMLHSGAHPGIESHRHEMAVMLKFTQIRWAWSPAFVTGVGIQSQTHTRIVSVGAG